MPTPSTEDLAWAAGLFEGEGCVTLHQGTYPVLTVTSTDEDVIEKFHEIVQVGSSGYKHEGRERRKTAYSWRVANFEETQAVCAYFWRWLGSRRRERIEFVLRVRRSIGTVGLARELGHRKRRRALALGGVA